MVHGHTQRFVQVIGEQRAVARGRLALDTQQGNDMRGLEVGDKLGCVKVCQHALLVSFDKLC